MTPEELWKLAVSGNQHAWSSLFDMFGGRLYQFFLKNTSNPETAIDNTQEVFLRLYRNRESFRTGQLKPWIFRIARNLLIDEWRRRGKADIPSDSLPELPDRSDSVEETAIARIEHGKMVELINCTMSRLPENERIVIGLVYLGGLTLSELALIMEIPLGTAKTHLRQARLHLDRLILEKMQMQAKGADL